MMNAPLSVVVIVLSCLPLATSVPLLAWLWRRQCRLNRAGLAAMET